MDTKTRKILNRRWRGRSHNKGGQPVRQLKEAPTMPIREPMPAPPFRSPREETPSDPDTREERDMDCEP